MWDQVLPEKLEGTHRLADGRVLAVIPPEQDGGQFSLAVVAPDFPAVEGSFTFASRDIALRELERWTPSADSPAPLDHSGGSWQPFTNRPKGVTK